jgi:hypothetical protein
MTLLRPILSEREPSGIDDTNLGRPEAEARAPIVIIVAPMELA